MIGRPGFSLPFQTVFGTGATNDIPEMTDPLGRHWRMPAGMRHVLMDKTHARLTARQLRDLPEYSSSYPSGTYDGKCWKRINGDAAFLCWYHPCAEAGMIGIGSRLIVEVDYEPQ